MVWSRIVAVLVLLVPGFAHAADISEAVETEGLRITARLVRDVALDRKPAGMALSADAVHLECDVRALKGEAHGFPEGSFIPYLSISYALTKTGAPAYRKAGLFYPMAAQAGPHYGAQADLAGPGRYELTYMISPPPSRGMLRHSGKDDGVPDWWKPLRLTWSFTIPDTAATP